MHTKRFNNMQAILFDLDNTLTHRDQSVKAFSQQLLDHFNAQLNIQSQHQLDQTISIIRRIDNGGYPLKERLTHPSIAASVAYALIQELNWNEKPDLDLLTAFWFEQFGLSAVPMQDAEVVLEQLKRSGYTLAVISNGGHATRLKILQGLGFTDYFDEIFSSERVGIAKPNSEIFLHSCEKLQVRPEQSLYVGDHPINDYQGAQQAGLNALLLEGFHSLEPTAHLEPIHKIQRLTQIFDYL